MKKLMMAAAIVCAAVAAQAATFDWSSASIYGPTAANLTTPGTYGVGSANADKLTMETMSKKISWAATMSIVSSLGTDEITFTPKMGSTGVSGANLTSSKIANGTDENPVTATVTTVLVGTYTVGDVTYTLTSNPIVSSEESFGALTTLNFSAPAATSWTVAVPEPTSGLLLLLGVAGMALRRRRA